MGIVQPFVSLNTADDTLGRIQASIARTVNPIVSLPRTQGITLAKVKLVYDAAATVPGLNVVQHMLNRPLIGWSISRKRGPGAIYDLQDSNQTPGATLLLQTDTTVVIDLEVW